MHVMRVLLIGMLLVALPVMAGADIIPISDVNENNANGFPVLRDSVVTVRGVAVVGSGVLDDDTDIYIQDDTGGVNVRQTGMASPIVAVGDSVRVTGYVDHATSSGRTALFVAGIYPGTRMSVLSSGNELPEPLELTTGRVWAEGNDLEGRYAVIRGVSFAAGYGWPDCGNPPSNRSAEVADGDTSCWLWFDGDTDLCGSEPPLETFDVYGVVVPDIISDGGEHGILPVMRSHVLSTGPGSGFATVEPGHVYTNADSLDLSFGLSADGGELTEVSITLPAEWTFSGDVANVVVGGPAFAGAVIEASADEVTLTGCELSQGIPGTVTLERTMAPAAAGTYVFGVKTAGDGETPQSIQTEPSVRVGAQAAEGSVLINEIYAHSGGSDFIDRSEFIELHNPGENSIDLTGWVLTDIDNAGNCAGSNLWEFPEGATIAPGGYVVVAKDARFSYGSGFYYVFGEWPDFEMFDPYGIDLDWPDSDAPNMLLASPDDGNTTVNQEIRLLGGSDGSGTLAWNTPAYDAVLLYTDRTLVHFVDAVEYRNPVFMAEDPCAGAQGLGGADDSWVPGPPPRGTSLARDAASTDTDVSLDDFFLADPTPGEPNPDSDVSAPFVESASGASHNLALVEFSEPVDRIAAEDVYNYTIGDGVMVDEATLSRNGRTVLLTTTDRVPGQSYSIEVTGVADLSDNIMADTTRVIQIGASTISIAEAQEYDENGLSVRSGETVKTAGFVTVPPGVFQPQYTSMYIQEPGGQGINVFAFGQMTEPALEGDLISTTGDIVDYIGSTGSGATTEIEASAITVLARGFDPVEPTALPTGDVGREENEGLFVQTTGVIVSVEGFALYVDDGSGSIQIYQNFNDLDFSVFSLGDEVSMTGVILQYDQTMPFFSGYELSPRYDSDMKILATRYTESADIAVTARVLDLSAEEAIEISYNAPRASHVTVRIFDLKGREVTTIYDGICLGPQVTTWDARDDNGKKVPIGAYICHVLARDSGRGDGSNAAIPIVVGTKLD